MNDDETCPHCGCKIGDLWEYDLTDEEETEGNCSSCERPIKITLNVSYIYTIEKGD